MRTWSTQDTLGVVAGAVAAGGSLAWSERRGRRPGTAEYCVGLVAAAAIYPLARTRRGLDRATVTEFAGLAAYTVVGARLSRLSSARGRRLAGLAWATHAAFDFTHEVGEDSRIPGWYPAACAAYDVGIAAHLIGASPSR